MLMGALVPKRPLKPKQSVSVRLATEQNSKKPTDLLRLPFYN